MIKERTIVRLGMPNDPNKFWITINGSVNGKRYTKSMVIEDYSKTFDIDDVKDVIAKSFKPDAKKRARGAGRPKGTKKSKRGRPKGSKNKRKYKRRI